MNYRLALSASVLSNRSKDQTALLNMLDTKTFDPYFKLMCAFAEANKEKEALEILAKMRSLQFYIPQKTYQALFRMYRRTKNINGMTWPRLYWRLYRKYCIGDYNPCSQLIFIGAYALLTDMQNNKIQLTTSTLNEIIAIQTKVGHIHSAFQTIELESTRSTRPNSATFHLLLQGIVPNHFTN
jgi:hypothetical protein